MAEQLYAHALIELEDGTRFDRGETLPEDIPGIEDIKEAGSASTEPYDETQDQLPPPEEVEIEGFIYKRTGEDTSTTGERGDRNDG